MRKHGKMTIRRAYEMVMPYHLHMPSYFLETFTEYPYISDWRHSCHFHSHISTLPIFQCDCQQEPVVHLPYRLRNRGSHSFYLAALHHNPLSRLPYRPHNQLYLSRHIGTAAQATAHLLQLLPEVRIIVNPILQLTVSHLRIQIREITQGQFGAAIRAYLKILHTFHTFYLLP